VDVVVVTAGPSPLTVDVSVCAAAGFEDVVVCADAAGVAVA
jgi:hypothetical protein